MVFNIFIVTANPVLSGHSKIDITMVVKPCGNLMQVKRSANAPREHSALLLTCIKRLLVLKPQFFVFSEWLLKTDFTI